MKQLIALVVLVLAAMASAQADKTESPAMSEIDEALQDRMTQQSDKWFEDGLFPTIIQMLRVEQEWYPFNEEITTDLGWMYKNVERPELEWLTYIKYAKRNEKDRDHLYPVANFYFMAKSYVSVINVLHGIDKQDPAPHPNAFRILAHAYSRVGLHTDSLRIWDAYIKIAPDDLQAKNNRQKEVDIMSGKVKPTAAVPPVPAEADKNASRHPIKHGG